MPGRFLLVLVLFPLLLSYAEENRSAPTYYYYHLAIDGTYEHITTTQGTPARYQLHVKALIPADDYSLIRFRPTRTPPLSARTTTPGHEPGVSGTFGNLGTRVFVRNFARDILPNLDPNGVYSFTVSPRFTDLRDYTLTITITRCPVDSEEDLPEFGLLSNSSVFNHTTNTLLKKPSPEPTLASHPRQRISSSTTNKSAISLDLAPDNGLNAPREADRRRAAAKAPGIFLAVNLLDTDKDGIPDVADGYDLILNNRNQAGNGKSARFTSFFLELNGPIDFARARIRFSYSASDPARIMQQGNGTDAMPYSYTPAAGNLRIWIRDGEKSRRKASVAAGGDFIPADVALSPAQLGLTAERRRVTLYIEAIRPSVKVGDQSITATIDLDGDGPGNLLLSDTEPTTIFTIDSVHPIKRDFANGKVGRVMISTRHDKHYHTRVKTTSSNRPAQTEDGKVVISAYVKPALANVPVYFELIDPDDRSPYDGKKKPKEQGNKDPNDNRDPTKAMKGGRLKDYTAFQDACLPARSARTRLKKIDGIQRAVAEITLNITDRHAGDNYRVRASCRDPQGKPFDSHSGTTNDGAKTVDTIPRSAVLIAWKRVYIEQDEMYQKGATILRVTRNRHNGKMSLELHLDNTDDFGVFPKKGSLITIFTADGKTVDKKVSAVTRQTITVVAIKKNDKRIRIPKYSGVRLSRDNRTYKVSTHLFPKAFGRRSDGADGGTFVEFVWKHTGSSSIPKYTSFPNNDVEIEFCNHWYKNKGDKTNIFQLVASHRSRNADIVGRAYRNANISLVYIGAIEAHDFDADTRKNVIADTAVHEIGHQFGLTKGLFPNNLHIDRRKKKPSSPNHEGTDQCVMSYNTNDQDDITEFDIDCLNFIRDVAEPR